MDAAAEPVLDASRMREREAAADAAPLCGAQRCACADGLDNDADGLVDERDPHCTSPYENDEQPYDGIWGDHRTDACQGCFFSGNVGDSDDGCRVPYSCLISGEAEGSGGCSSCEASQKCQDYCLPRVPDGCDCFGCCAATAEDGGARYVLLDTGCDPTQGLTHACKSCVPSATCFNSCEPCEQCLGGVRTGDCTDAGTVMLGDAAAAAP